MEAVPTRICLQLFLPEVRVSARRGAIFASSVTVPKTAMHEDHSLEFREDDIWLTGQFFNVQPEAITVPVQKGPDDHFGPRVLALDTAHVP